MYPADMKDKNIHLQYHNIKVLMYHRIAEESEFSSRNWTQISREHFRRHLLLLEKWGFTPITFKDYLLFLKNQLHLPKKPVIITLDDGYEEVYNIAFPMLKEMGWNAVVFVIGDKRIKMDLWNAGSIPEHPNLLNSSQIHEIHEAGFEIGSHSMSHRFLPAAPCLTAWYEISKSKEELEDLLGSRVFSFCYPYGAVNEQVKQLVKKAGYEVGCGVFTGHPRFGTDIFDVRRITVPGRTSSLSFALKMLTPFEYYEYAGSMIKRRSKSYHSKGYNPEIIKAIKTDRTHVNV
jgi:peptidoglycan/xylan/chitin deacetylase (PgdA/CDA1 family)